VKPVEAADLANGEDNSGHERGPRYGVVPEREDLACSSEEYLFVGHIPGESNAVNGDAEIFPAAGARYGSHDGWTAIEELQRAGVEQLEVLHTRSSAVADLAAFAAPLKEATGVWFSGGRQFRLVDVYLQTETHRELRAVLERGGIIGGNSAGASALASYLVRGSEDAALVMAPDKDIGFGFLRNVAIDQHILARGRENNLLDVLTRDGIGVGSE